MVATTTHALGGCAYGELSLWGDEAVRDVGGSDKRILAVAGEQGDNVEGTKAVVCTFRDLGNRKWKERYAYIVEDVNYGWDL